jgi:hypothetical protein
MLMDMSKKLIESLNKEIKSLMNKDFNLRKSLEKLELTIIGTLLLDHRGLTWL